MIIRSKGVALVRVSAADYVISRAKAETVALLVAVEILDKVALLVTAAAVVTTVMAAVVYVISAVQKATAAK